MDGFMFGRFLKALTKKRSLKLQEKLLLPFKLQEMRNLRIHEFVGTATNK
jgi:hypothetical protein